MNENVLVLDVDNFKKISKRLHKELINNDVSNSDWKLTKVQESLARAMGYRDWYEINNLVFKKNKDNVTLFNIDKKGLIKEDEEEKNYLSRYHSKDKLHFLSSLGEYKIRKLLNYLFNKTYDNISKEKRDKFFYLFNSALLYSIYFYEHLEISFEEFTVDYIRKMCSHENVIWLKTSRCEVPKEKRDLLNKYMSLNNIGYVEKNTLIPGHESVLSGLEILFKKMEILESGSAIILYNEDVEENKNIGSKVIFDKVMKMYGKNRRRNGKVFIWDYIFLLRDVTEEEEMDVIVREIDKALDYIILR